jgi:hypothetical protein
MKIADFRAAALCSLVEVNCRSDLLASFVIRVTVSPAKRVGLRYGNQLDKVESRSDHWGSV